MSTSTADYLAALLAEAGFIEICHMDPHPVSAWFHEVHAALAWARQRSRTGNLFTTLSQIDLGLLDAHIRARMEEAPGKPTRTPDSTIGRYTRLFFDLDSERPKNTASTEIELEEARIRVEACRTILSAHDWPAPALAMSGNGWHLQYRAPLPNTAEFTEALATIYAELHYRLSDDMVTFDRSVRNPARLCTLYGSIKRKGIATPDRPHRQSWIAIPSDWKQVHPRQVLALADRWAKIAARRAQEARHAPRSTQGRPTHRITGKGAYNTLDVVSWFRSRGHYQGPGSKPNVHRVLCPWHSEHTSSTATGAAIFEPNGAWPSFHCHHSHCAGRTIRDVIALWGDADQFCSSTFERRVA
ncbi:MAG: hypothetical protein C1943_03830 [Halochromatium sp.]|nr:hypothetical protein [Halochromatium sp.]